MSTLNIQFDGEQALIQFNRPKAHAMNPEMIIELTEALGQMAESTRIRGAILTGDGSIFSAGLDVVELFAMDEDSIELFWHTFHNLLLSLVKFPKPLVAAVNGHAIAGGCVMALCCDHRVMAEGRAVIGLNEVPVGLVVPQTVIDLATHHVGTGKAKRMLLNGTLFPATDAQAFGLVDELCPAEEVLERAQAKLHEWFAVHPDAWLKTKALLQRPLIEKLNVGINEGYGETIREWWSADGRDAVRKTLEKLGQKKSG